MNSITTRRQFLAGSAAGLATLNCARPVLSQQPERPLRLALFGTKYNASHMLAAPHLYNAPIVAFCEPDQRRAAKVLDKWKSLSNKLAASRNPQESRWAEYYRGAASGKGVKLYTDIRRLFEEMSDSIDALVVSQVDHMHGVSCGPALRAGKPVLSERPLGLTISEARQLRQLAAAQKLPATYRSPGTASGQFRRAMELVEDNAIGPVEEVHVWFDRHGADRDAPPSGSQPIPKELDWNAWLGPLHDRPYHPEWMAYANWRESSSGGLGTFGPHTTIFPFLTLKLRRLWDEPVAASAIRVSAECEKINRISFPRWERVRWQVPARADMPPVTITWHHGPGFAPGARELIHGKLRRFGVTGEQAGGLMGSAGSMLVGTEGALLANDHSAVVTCLPSDKFKDVETDQPQRLARSRNIYYDWIDACRGGESQILASFDNGGPLSELLMLGNIATLYPGETLSYDPAQGRLTNKDEANERLVLRYREGWSL